MRSTREETAAYGTVFSGGEGGRNLVAEGPGARIFAGIAERDARAANGVDRDVATALVNDGAGAAVVDALGLGGAGRHAARLMPAVAGAARTLGFVCASVLFQRVIMDCIDEPSDVEAYARNRTALTGALAEYGYTYVEPDGAFYLWVKALEPDANAFCERAKKYELLAVPSDSFGMPGWFRLGYCVSHETIVNSLPAWKKLAEEYRA